LLITAFTALALALTGTGAQAQTTTVTVPANVEWFDTGIDVQAGASNVLSISATGRWRNVPKGLALDAAGYGSTRLPNALAPAELFGSLIGRVNGTIFGIGKSFKGNSPASGRLFLSMNDVPGTYGDNSGQLRVVVTKSVSGVTSGFTDPILLLDLLSTDPIPFYERPSFHWVLKNRTRPSFSGEFRVLLDGVLTSADISLPTVSSLGPSSELSGTLTLSTGTPPNLTPGNHTVILALTANTPDHAVVVQSDPIALTAVVPTPPPSIVITEFKAKPDYQDQGKEVELSWKLQPTSSCVAADLALTKKDYGEPEVQILAVPKPATSDSKSVVVKGTSSPLRYRLSVSCRFCAACQTLASTTTQDEVKVSFSPTPPAPTPYLVVNGPFFTPSGDVREKSRFTVSWTIENLGGAPLEEFDVELFLDGAKEGGTKTIPKLDAGKNTNEATWEITKELPVGGHQLELKRKVGGGSLGFKPFDVVPSGIHWF